MLPYFYSCAASSQPQGRQAYWQLELWSCKRSLDLKSVFASLSEVPQRLQWMQNKCATCCYKSLHSCQIEIPQPKKCSPTRFLPTDFCSAVHDEGCRAGASPVPLLEGSLQLFHARCWLACTRVPRAPRPSCQMDPCGVGSLMAAAPLGDQCVRIPSYASLPSTNPLRSPDTFMQTLFPNNPQGSRATAFRLAPLMKPSQLILCCMHRSWKRDWLAVIYTLPFPCFWL